jgi:acylaminoacyl-peptidase
VTFLLFYSKSIDFWIVPDTVSLPNYTGSTGYGEDFLQGLIGRCGDLDVADCIATARHLVKIGISEEGQGKQLIMGGSHGGFLGAHRKCPIPTRSSTARLRHNLQKVAGRFSSFFSAAVLRNPVISVSEMSASDIPDWCYSEFGVQYPLSSTPSVPTTTTETDSLPRTLPPLMTTEIFDKLRSSSPIRHVDQISIPVLLLIGKVDRRVIPSQGIELYHALKARNKMVEMLRFEGESHPLDGVEAAKISFEAAMDWFAQATDGYGRLPNVPS